MSNQFLFFQDWQVDTVSWNTATFSWVSLSQDNLWNNKAILSSLTWFANYNATPNVPANNWLTAIVWLYPTSTYTTINRFHHFLWDSRFNQTTTLNRFVWFARSDSSQFTDIRFEAIYNSNSLIVWRYTFTSMTDMNNKLPVNTWTNFIFSTDWNNAYIYRNWQLLNTESSNVYDLSPFQIQRTIKIWDPANTFWSEVWFNWRVWQSYIFTWFADETKALELYNTMQSRYLELSDISDTQKPAWFLMKNF